MVWLTEPGYEMRRDDRPALRGKPAPSVAPARCAGLPQGIRRLMHDAECAGLSVTESAAGVLIARYDGTRVVAAITVWPNGTATRALLGSDKHVISSQREMRTLLGLDAARCVIARCLGDQPAQGATAA